MYLYIETSSPRTRGDKADLVSHTLPANQTMCFNFAYNMYGAETGNLTVFLEVCCEVVLLKAYYASEMLSSLFLKTFFIGLCYTFQKLLICQQDERSLLLLPYWQLR
jgi:hypothetical protein